MFQSSINAYYQKHSASRVCQGDILRDFKFNVVDPKGKVFQFGFPYIVILSQDCDLLANKPIALAGRQPESVASLESQPVFNQYLHSILFLPAFPAEAIREGAHLVGMFGIRQDRLNSDRTRLIKDNKDPRYHYLNSDVSLQIPDIITDFKAYYTLPPEYFAPPMPNYLATANELFREHLSQRFAQYLSRIGLPSLTTQAPATPAPSSGSPAVVPGGDSPEQPRTA